MMTHWRSPSEKPRSVCAEGSAMFTTVASSTTMSCASPTVTSVHQRRGAGAGGVSEEEEYDMNGTLYGTCEFRI
ncbi:hypothetical protein GCM10025866_16840 [Naasia aerilata]|uniref:Uncharacterized protein n=1 Tax=Naasia aerilata TaxID=1162966 RepID=A0ABN6XLC9_9MICO|nr:hypothetical protein GCM10025866_16840 [Naasia aerilata]